MKILPTLIRWLIRLLSWSSLIVVGVMMVHIVLEVFLRYVFNVSIPGTLTFASRYYLPAIVFLPLALVEHENETISVEIFATMLPLPFQSVLAFLAYLLGAATFGALTYRTALDAVAKTAQKTFEMDYDMKFATWPGYYVLPIGFGCITLYLFQRIINSICGAIGARQSLEEKSLKRENI